MRSTDRYGSSAKLYWPKNDRQKSRSHLALFETVERHTVQRCQRQTEHHNAFGYLGRSAFNVSQPISPIQSSTGPESSTWYQRTTPTPIDGRMNQSFNDRNNNNLNRHLTRSHSRHQPHHRQKQVDRTTIPIETSQQLSSTFDDDNYWHEPRSSSTPIIGHRNISLTKAKQKKPRSRIIMSSGNDNSSQNRILIKGGRCVNDDAIFEADIYVEEGVIRDIGQHLIVPGGVKTIDARGFYVLPGGIDTHTHLNLSFMGAQSADDFYSGTKAALAGGTTTIMDYVIPEKGASMIDAYKKWRSLADGVACCDYTFRVAITEYKNGKTDSEMETLVKECGINGFKCFMAYKDILMLSDEELLNVFQKCRDLGALPLVHAENGNIVDYNVKKLKNLGISGPEGHLQSRPEEVEAEATNRAITIANQVNCPLYIVHVMSRSAADVIANSRNRGCVVFGEPITAGFGSDGTHYFSKCWRHAAAHVMSPPLRPDRTTSDHLINLLSSGQLHATGSDHCTFSSEQKALGSKDFSKIPNGVNGVEERLIILWEKAVKTGKMDVKQFVATTSTNAAKIFNIYPRKGRLAKGSDADIVIWGARSQVIKAESHHSNVDFNIFEGMHVTSGPLVVISNGRVVMDEDGLHVTQGSGRFVSCPPNSSFVFGAVNQRSVQPPIKIDRSGKTATVTNPTTASAAVPASNPISDGNGQHHQQLSTSPQSNGIHKISELNISGPSRGQGDVTDPNSAFYKGTTRSGVRNQQDSSFNLNGTQIDDDKIGKTAIRVHNPPGGRSSGIW
ncbi:hypothetical protein BLOT_001619 [Blomia tropicalis]|nr:hypothetical protein BLOT_001619 [Blomia tropicalis]